MITLEEIAERLKKEKNNKEPWKPIRASYYILPVCNIKRLSRKRLSKVLAFINSVKHKRFKDGCTIMPISVTNKVNLSIWNNPTGVTRAIEYMKELGLISIECDEYQHHAYYAKDNKSKTYRYYVENEHKIKEYCNTHNIEMFKIENNVYSADKPRIIHPEIDKSKVRFASNLKLYKPEGLSKSGI